MQSGAIQTLRLCTMLSTKFVRSCVLKNNWIRPLHLTETLQKSEADEPRLEVRDITKDRTQVIPVETSIKYLKSAAYKQTYGEQAVWIPYRRNHKGPTPPRKTRRTCIRAGQISTGNPCPICRDEYLVLHEQNIELLKQFVCPHTGSILGYSKTGLCRKRQEELLVMIERARDRGLLTFDVPFRKYDYSEYYKPGNEN